jgi:hypothetical protein
LAFPALVLAVFAATSILAWERQIDAPENAVYAGAFSNDRTWIDDALPNDGSVTKLYTYTTCGSATERHALYLTELFNSSVDDAAMVGDLLPDGLPIERVDVGAGGTLRLRTGQPLVAEYVYTQPALEVRGTRVGEGTAARLVLWRVDGPVAVRGATSNEELARIGC